LIELLLQSLIFLTLLIIHALKIATRMSPASISEQRPRREVDKKAGNKKTYGQREEKRYDSL